MEERIEVRVERDRERKETMEEESFEVRVKRLFGSHLFAAVPESSFPVSSWSVANGEVERREWNRQREGGDERDETPCSAAFDDPRSCFSKKSRKDGDRKKEEFEGDLDDLDDLDEEEEEEEEEGGADGDGEGGENREEREILSSVGLDPTLDREEEEDDYDREAVGREDTGDRMYMREITNHGRYMNIHNVVPDLFDDTFDEVHEFHRDPRADHSAAGARLREDNISDEKGTHSPFLTDQVAVDSRVKMAEDDNNLKPILKRKEGQDDSKPKKRVRFDSGCKDDQIEHHQPMDGAAEKEERSSLPLESPGVPDYVRNPSKYTCYTLDWSDNNDDESNTKAFQDFRNLVKRSDTDQIVSEFELPKSVTFTPRKKLVDAMSVDDAHTNENNSNEFGSVSSCYVRIAAGNSHEADACEMEEDSSETSTVVEASVTSRKAVRQYRSKSGAST
ncbi:uncharacterized protein [Typha angustifolia]|uniref:uncharacterized protein n=1 Tax=Typha angustifolia TaxID=59011 RepID=UPI003C2FDE0A